MSTVIFAVIGGALGITLPLWRVTGCRCGREKMPWLPDVHEKEWVQVILLLLIAVTVIGSVWAAGPIGMIVTVLLFVYRLRMLVEHRKGKRSILGRLLGRVVINRHGRLVVEP